MIINRSERRYYLEKLLNDKKKYSYVVTTTGTLSVNREYESYGFLAYQEGFWHGRKGKKRGTSEQFPELERNLFCISENKFWMSKDDGTAEYFSKGKPLSDNACAFLFAEQEDGMYLIIVDGKKYQAPLTLCLESSLESAQTLAVIVTGLVRQYDPAIAEEMEKFWFEKDESNLNKEDDLPWNE